LPVLCPFSLHDALPILFLDRKGRIGHIGPVRGPKVSVHGSVVPKGGGSGTDLGTHIADGALARTGHGSGPFPKIFYDGTGSSLRSEEHTSELQSRENLV